MILDNLLFILLFIVSIFITYLITKKLRDYHWKKQIPLHRQEAISQSRSVLTGQFSEQIAPYLPNFPYSPTECRFIGKPIDFVVFKGADQKQIEEVIFVEVKSGNAKLSPQEKNLKNAIEKKKVKFIEYRVPNKEEKSEDFKEL
ncbi:MAG: Holliday junction resolvase-like protein [Nanoarchaeota archaeon]